LSTNARGHGGWRRFRDSRRGKLTLSAAIVAALAAIGGLATWSAFTVTDSNTGNQFSAANITLTDNSSGSAMFNLTNAGNLTPSKVVSECITVKYTSTTTQPVTVTLYGGGSGSGTLGQYLNLTITRGSFSGTPPSYSSCTGFTADTTTCPSPGGSNGVVYSGTVGGFLSTYTSTSQLPDCGSWTATGDSHVYEFTVQVQSNNSAIGQSLSSVTFTWQASVS
jgi:hypothetical protein